LSGGLQPRVIPAEAMAAMSASKTWPTVSLKNMRDEGSREKARFMKAAIWPLVTGSSGQKWSLSGGLQPRVIPDTAIHSMSDS
jgi:hypothetical protein